MWLSGSLKTPTYYGLPYILCNVTCSMFVCDMLQVVAMEVKSIQLENPSLSKLINIVVIGKYEEKLSSLSRR